MQVEKGVLDFLYNSAMDVEYDHSWDNLTGYFDDIITSDFKEIFCFRDYTNRRVVVIPTEKECIVIHERYADGKQDVVVMQLYHR